MSPCASSTSGIAPFSFCVPANQPVINSSQGYDSAGTTRAPSGLILCSVGSAGKATGTRPAWISTLPLVLIHLIKKWLPDKDSVPLMLTSRHINYQVQAFYKPLLRPAVTERSASFITSFQNSVNRAPAFVPMGGQGEATFQMCLKMKATGLPETAYRFEVLAMLKRYLSESKDPRHLVEVSIGVALGLGGSLMTTENRDALLACILDSYATSTKHQMGAMMLGFCTGFGRNNSQVHLHATLEKILASYATSSAEQMALMSLATFCGIGLLGRMHEYLPAVLAQILGSNKTCDANQMGALIHSVCRMLGGPEITSEQRQIVLTRILAAYETSQPMQLQRMIQCAGLALGGINMTPQHRDWLIDQILGACALNKRMPMGAMIQGLYNGLGGRVMKQSHLDAVLARITGRYAFWGHIEMGVGILNLCQLLGGRDMSPAHRDRVVEAILASYETTSPAQMGSMFYSMCKALGNATVGAANIAHTNLDALLLAVLGSHATSSAAQMGTMIDYICRALGNATMLPAHRGALAARIQGSGRVNEMAAAIKLTPNGQRIVDFLQLEPAGGLAALAVRHRTS